MVRLVPGCRMTSAMPGWERQLLFHKVVIRAEEQPRFLFTRYLDRSI